MSIKKQIKTTGDLRKFLAATIVDVESGDIDLDKARSITKLAGQINESLYAEIKVAKTLAETGKDMESLGNLSIGNKD